MARRKTLVEKLRALGGELYIYRGSRRVILEAADELERLQAEVARMQDEIDSEAENWSQG